VNPSNSAVTIVAMTRTGSSDTSRKSAAMPSGRCSYCGVHDAALSTRTPQRERTRHGGSPRLKPTNCSRAPCRTTVRNRLPNPKFGVVSGVRGGSSAKGSDLVAVLEAEHR
jgi:hypothetical protein